MLRAEHEENFFDDVDAILFLLSLFNCVSVSTYERRFWGVSYLDDSVFVWVFPSCFVSCQQGLISGEKHF